MTDEPGPPGLTPALLAARRARGTAAGPREDNRRGYPQLPPIEDPLALAAELGATHALLHAMAPAEVALVIATLIHDLGGALLPARLADPAMVIDMDVSLGLTEPVLVFADPVSAAAMVLSAVLPRVLEDARTVLARLEGAALRDDEGMRDPLTGVLTRRAWMRRLAGAAPGDSVCFVDLDGFKAVNDSSGHQTGDAVLRALGGLLARSFREADACGRYGGDELVCLAAGMPGPALAERCDQLRRGWERERPVDGAAVGLTIGVADVDERGGRAALHAADTAMYRGKIGGRNRTELATAADYEGGPP